MRLRGIDYPTVEFDSRFGENYPIAGGWEGWEKFNDSSVWRLTQSGQFLHLFTLREEGDDGWTQSLAQSNGSGPFLDFENTIYQLTEIVEFAARLVTTVDYSPTLAVEVELHGMRDRRLVAPRRSLTQDYKCGVPTIPVGRPFKPLELPSQRHELAEDLASEVFTYFGLTLDRHIISGVRQKILGTRTGATLSGL